MHNGARPDLSGPVSLGHNVIYDDKLQEIRRNGRTVVLQKRQALLLSYLIENAGQKLPRDQLLGEVWADRVVNDEALSRAIAELRSALGDSPKNPRFIKTLPRVGYCFVATPAKADTSRRRWAPVLAGLVLLIVAAAWLIAQRSGELPAKSLLRAEITPYDYAYGGQYFLSSSRDGEYALFASDVLGESRYRVVNMTRPEQTFEFPAEPGSIVAFSADPLTLLVGRVADGRCQLGEYSLLTDRYIRRSACPGGHLRIDGAIPVPGGGRLPRLLRQPGPHLRAARSAPGRLSWRPGRTPGRIHRVVRG